MTSITARDANGAQVALDAITMPDGTRAIVHVLVDANNVPYGATHPLLTAPAIRPADFTPYTGTVATAGAVIVDTAGPNAARAGGYITAGQANAGLITLTLIKVDGTTTSVAKLPAGASFPFAVNPGVVLQQRFTVSGDTVGDTFSGVEFS